MTKVDDVPLLSTPSKMAKKKDSDKPVGSEEQEKTEEMEDSEEPNFSDPEDYVDEIDDAGFLVDVLMMKPTQDDGVDNIIVVDGIPEVGTDRLEKLQNVLRKLYSKYGKVVNEFYPVDENGVTKGFMFLEYSCPSHAQEAVKMTNGYKLDKQHTFHVNVFTDFDKYENIPKNWVPPEPQPYEDHGNLRQYLEDPDCFDQFSVIYEAGDKVAIYLNSVPEPTLLEERSKWTETYVRWSPLGTYLATFHPRGIALWGGPSFSQVMKFSHQGVQFIDFSPCEKYLVTLSPNLEARSTEEPQTVIIWDIRTGNKKRAFHAGKSHVWPLFKWSHDDKYFARISPDLLSVYETPSFGLLDKKSFKIQGIRDFSWSPTSNIIAYWVAEEKDIPARVTLLNIPGRQEIRVKNLFNVADCKMHWQKFGDYLCVKVDRYVKSRKGERDEWKYSGIYYNFEIFHLQEKQIPVDSVEIKETVHAFAWEPVGSKFAVIHGDSPNISVSFYSVKTGQTPSLLKKYEKEACNHLFWGPQGQFIVLAGLRSMNGTLKFIDTKDFTVMNSGEHFMATDVEWDPTGRYIVTGVSWWGNKVDNGYWLWTFQGKVLQRQNLDSFCQLLWRPRPPTLLSSQQIKDIKKNLKEKYSPQFDLKDKMRLSKESKELVEKRRKLMAEFEAYRQRAMEVYVEQRRRRWELRNNVDTDELESDQLEEETVEFLVKEEEVFC